MTNQIYRIALFTLAATICTQTTAAAHNDFSTMSGIELEQLNQQLEEKLREYREELISFGPFSSSRGSLPTETAIAVFLAISSISIALNVHLDSSDNFPIEVLMTFLGVFATYEILTTKLEDKPEIIDLKKDLLAIQEELYKRDQFFHKQLRENSARRIDELYFAAQ